MLFGNLQDLLEGREKLREAALRTQADERLERAGVAGDLVVRIMAFLCTSDLHSITQVLLLPVGFIVIRQFSRITS